MLTKRKRPRNALSTIMAGVLLLAAACQPSGPKSLIKGQEYIREGEHEKALAVLKQAAELMPAHPQVWNHLGLAYHGLGESEKAIQAYHQALQLDRNLAVARFNLGMLFLDANRLPEAISEFSSFTVLQPEEAIGWKKLGTTFLRAGRYDEAGRALDRALRITPKDAEILNDLGLVHLHRKRPREAVLSFNAALNVQPGYPPALLNQAIVAEQYFDNEPAALERYKAYLFTRPPEAEAQKIQQIISRLEREVNPPAVADVPATLTNEPPAQPATNLASAGPGNQKPLTETKKTATETPRQTNQVAVAKTNSAPPAVKQTNVTEVAATPPAQPTNQVDSGVSKVVTPPKTNIAAATSPDVRKPTQPAAEPEPEVEPEPLQIEVVQLDTEPQFKAPVDAGPRITRTPPPTNEVKVAAANAPAADERPLFAPRPQEPDKPGLVERLNPVGWFRRDDRSGKPVPPPVRIPPSRPVVLRAPGDQPEEAAPPREYPRYEYRKSGSFQEGDREQAQKHFRDGADAHYARRTSDAVQAYRQAIAADPSFFDAYYNLGIAAFEAKDLPLALSANEQAVALRSGSVNARYNFAVTLRNANYPVDAANELRQLLVESPDDARAHFALGNLYSQELNEPILARRHYRRFLELNPGHPQSPVIREWLANQ